MDSIDDTFSRVRLILAPGQSLEMPPDVSHKTLTTYLQFLKSVIPAGALLTGLETMGYFQWEERFEWGDDDNQQEYDTLRKTYGSVEDTFRLLEWGTFNEEVGIMISVARVSDDKKFEIPLADLQITDEEAKEYQWVDDYITWFVNGGE